MARVRPRTSTLAAMALRWLYLLSVSLLIAHEIDSAYWMEWRLFELPGGSAGFFAANLPLIALFIWGYERVCADSRAGWWLSLMLPVIGLFICGTHATFLIAGSPDFRTPASLALLAALAVAAGWQLPLALRQLRPEAPEHQTAAADLPVQRATWSDLPPE